MRHSSLLAVAATLLVGSVAERVSAQDYPTRSIKMIVPFAAGGPLDVAGRKLAEAMSRQLKQTVFVENIGGAVGNIGAGRAAQSAPDGYTMLFANFSIALSPSMGTTLNYDAVRDFASVSVPFTAPSVVVAAPRYAGMPFKEFIEHLKTSGDKISAATTGPGGPSGLCASLLMKELQTKFTIVPYQGTGPAMIDVVAGRVDFVCSGIVNSAPQIRAGAVRAIGVAGTRRARIMPEVPTLQEQGLQNVTWNVWSGLYVPKKTPRPIVERLSEAVRATVKDPELLAGLEALGLEPTSDELFSPAVADQYLVSEIAKWATILKPAAN